MAKTSPLAEKHCIPCKGDVPPLDAQSANNFLKELNNDWQINQLGHLSREYKFANFMDALAFANNIATIAEQEAHHPDLTISWGACKVEIWTHKINGLTESDFILAAKIDALK